MSDLDALIAAVDALSNEWDGGTHDGFETCRTAVMNLLHQAKAESAQDSFERVADDAINELQSEELVTEQEFGIGDPSENYFEGSQRLRARFRALGGKTQHKAFGEEQA